MQIAVLAPLRFPIREPFHGGLEMHTHLLVRELVARGHSVTLFAHPDSDPTFKLVPVRLPEGGGFGATLFTYRRAMRAIARGNFDAVHDNSIHFLPPLLAGTVGCPVVTTLHTPPYKSLRFAGRLARRISAHQFVSISHHLHDVWKRYLGEHEVVHNGLKLEDWPFRETAEAGTAIWYGRFTPEKGAEYAITAARRAGYRLTLAGPVYDQAYFDAHVTPELDADITYAGHLAQSDLAALVGRAEVGIVSSVWDEPFGLVYAEMLACGTPVAAFDSGAAGEIITTTCGALVPKYDVAALAQVLGSLQKKDRHACRELVETTFPVSRMVARYERLYQVGR